MKFFLLCALFLFSCSPVNRNENSLESNVEQEKNSMKEFRDIFYTLAKNRGIQDEEIQKQIFFYPERNFDTSRKEKVVTSKEDFKQFQEYSSEDLYETGKEQAPKFLADLKSNSSIVPTLIMFPGNGGEFADTMLMNGVFHSKENNMGKQSSFYKKWNDKLSQEMTSSYSLNKLGREQISLDKTIALSSIDDQNGNPVINLINLTPKRGSLESFGSYKVNASIFLERIDKVLDIIDVPDNSVYLLGYSRGALIGLDLLVRAKRSNASWYPKLKGFVSLAGVLYGADNADSAFTNSNDPNYDLKSELKKLADSLEAWSSQDERNHGVTEKSLRMAKNLAKWAAFVKFYALPEIYKLVKTYLFKKEKTGIQLENIDIKNPHLSVGVDFALNFATNIFTLDSPHSKHFQNVKRFKVLVDSLLEAAKGMTAGERLKWWKENKLPQDLSYFSISGVMPSKTTDQYESPLFSSPYYYNRSIDFQVMRTGFYNIASTYNNRLNDGQVTLEKSVFWPQLSEHFHGLEGSYQPKTLAILGTHHWGLSQTIVTEMSDRMVNPFPRSILLESLGIYLSNHDL